MLEVRANRLYRWIDQDRESKWRQLRGPHPTSPSKQVAVSTSSALRLQRICSTMTEGGSHRPYQGGAAQGSKRLMLECLNIVSHPPFLQGRTASSPLPPLLKFSAARKPRLREHLQTACCHYRHNVLAVRSEPSHDVASVTHLRSNALPLSPLILLSPRRRPKVGACADRGKAPSHPARSQALQPRLGYMPMMDVG